MFQKFDRLKNVDSVASQTVNFRDNKCLTIPNFVEEFCELLPLSRRDFTADTCVSEPVVNLVTRLLEFKQLVVRGLLSGRDATVSKDRHCFAPHTVGIRCDHKGGAGNGNTYFSNSSSAVSVTV